jgi:hypothetical protein
MKNFLCTRTDGIYSVFTAACKKNLEDRINQKLNVVFIKKQIPSLAYIVFVIKSLIFNKISRSKLIDLKYKQFRVGRYIMPTILKNYDSYFKIFSYYYEVIRNIFHAGYIVKFLEKTKNLSGAYVDHGVYINGLIIEHFIKEKKIVYSNNYPRTLFAIIPGKFSKFEDVLKIKKRDSLFYKKNTLSKNKIFSDPKTLPYMKDVNFKKIPNEINYNKFDYIIYAHSFTDAQLVYGNDGFSNVYDWLIFTINYLRKKNKSIIVKAHPNFYYPNNKKRYFDPLAYNDNLIYQKITRRYKADKSILFLDKAFSNLDFLKLLNKKKHILISHHGTSILESAYFQFKCICSKASPWETKFKVANYFSNKKNYRLLLDRSINSLEKANRKDLNNLIYELYFADFALFGKKSYFNFLRKNFNFTKPLNRKYSPIFLSKLKKMNKAKLKLILDLSKNIQLIK